jgi:anti-anti-sigma factor
MAAPQGTVRYHQQPHAVTFRVEGRATMNQSLPLRQCAERLIAAGVSQVRVDLRACSYVDSTFVGTLLTLKKATDRHAGHFSLVMPSPACGKILQQMGLMDLLPAESSELDPDAEWSDLAVPPADPTSFRQNVAEAHKELADLPGTTGKQFEAVMRCIEQTARPAKPPE